MPSLRLHCQITHDPLVVIYALSVDHALKDPTPDAVVIEELHTMLDVHPWGQAAAHMDARWWLEIDPARAKTR